MRRLFISILLLLFINLGRAQDYQIIDSLKKELSSAKEDTNKVILYYNLGIAYQWSFPDSALSYAIPGLALCRKLQYERGELKILFPISEALSMKGNYSKALELRFQSLELATKLKDSKEIADALTGIGSVYYYSKDYQKALIFFYKAKALDTVLFGNPELINGFIGETYFHLNQLDSALFYIQKAYDIDIQNTAFHWSVPYFYLAAINEKKGNIAKAINLYKKSISVAIAKLDVIIGYNGIASVYKKIGQTDSAIFYTKKAITEGTNASFPAPVIEASTILVDIYRSNNTTDSAFKYQELLLAAKDSLFSQEKIKQMQNVAFNEQMRQQEIEADKEQYKSRIRLYILIVALIVFITIGAILWQNNLQKQKAFDLLEKQKAKTEQTLLELKSTQNQLIQKEKMASLGELTAGIAHEIQNPLNFVNNFSEVSLELVEEIEEELGKVNLLQQEKQYLLKLLVDLSQNQEKIHNHGKRADSIVKGMLQHSISHTGEKEPTDINALVEEYLRLSYHGLRAKNKDFNVDFKLEAGPAVGKVEVVPQEIGRVLLNLFNNAFYATAQKKLQLNGQYKPLVIVSTKTIGDKVEIRVRDNGTGIPQAVQQKIFQPFFTTKPTGEGTGLGLSLSYDIITKGYGGELKVDSKEGEYTELTISLISFKVADHVY